MLDARGLGARQRVAADEALIVDRGHERALGRADVGHHAGRRGGRQRLLHHARQRPHRRGDERRVGALHRLGGGAARHVDRAVLERAVEDPGAGIEAADLGAESLPGGEPNGPADQADTEDRDDQALTLDRTLPATAAARSTCST